MRFTVDSKILINNLNDILMRGDYPNGASVGRRNLSPSAYVVVEPNGVKLYNADLSTVCSSFIPLDTVEDIGECAIDIETFSKYLKTFSGDVIVTIGDYVNLKTASKTASFGIAVGHRHYAMIERLRNTVIPTEGMPTFGKNNTSFETHVIVNDDVMVDAAKGCDVLKTARYKFDYDGENFTLSSSRSGTVQNYSTIIDTLAVIGEQSTVEITGAFSAILDGVTSIYLKDDFPVLIRSGSRMLLKAPYLER